MASISGTVTVGGAVPTGDIEVNAYDMNSPAYFELVAGGPPLLDYNDYANVSNVDGSYTLDGLVEGHYYALQVMSDDTPATAKVTWYPAAANYGGGLTIQASGAIVGADIACLAADGTHITGSSINCPPATVYVFVYALDESIEAPAGFFLGSANGPFTSLYLAELHAAQNYRLMFACLDTDGNPLSLGWYDGHSYNDIVLADLVLGDEVITLDCSSGFRRIPRFFVAPGAGAHFKRPL
jgi:hypothetical protein